MIGCLPRRKLDVLPEGWARARGVLDAGALERHAREVQGAVA